MLIEKENLGVWTESTQDSVCGVLKGKSESWQRQALTPSPVWEGVCWQAKPGWQQRLTHKTQLYMTENGLGRENRAWTLKNSVTRRECLITAVPKEEQWRAYAELQNDLLYVIPKGNYFCRATYTLIKQTLTSWLKMFKSKFHRPWKIKQ